MTYSATALFSNSNIQPQGCFPKDTKALAVIGKEYGLTMNHTETTIASNEAQKMWCAEKVLKHYGGNVSGKTFAVWGLAFKANTDDMRDASAIVLINHLLTKGARFKVHDPEAMDNARKLFGDKVEYCEKRDDALVGADAVIVLTEWLDYRMPDYLTLRKWAVGLNDKVVFDFRNLYARFKEELKADELTRYGVGIVQ